MAMVLRMLIMVAVPIIGLAQAPVVREPMAFNFPVVKSLNPLASGLQQSPIIQTSSIDQRQVHRQIMAEVDAHEKLKQQHRQNVDEAITELEKEVIYYNLPVIKADKKRPYDKSFDELASMLNGDHAINLKRAVYLVESAYDTTLKYDMFDRQLREISYILQLRMKQDKVTSNDNIGKVMTLYQFMTDTLKVKNPASEKTITTYPKTYDFDDFWGRKDYRKMFVSKLLSKGSGQCHSLPLLFLLLADEIKADVNLAFAPNHSFIKFKDNRGRWHNIELTAGVFASDHFMIESGYIKSEALRNRIYLEPLNKKQVIAQCLNDLAMGYSRQVGNDEFMLKCSKEVMKHSPNSISANQIYSNYYNSLLEYVAWQYMRKGKSQSEFKQDVSAMGIYKEAQKAIAKIEALGYSDMPPEAYSAWLETCKKEALKQEHLNEFGALKNMIIK